MPASDKSSPRPHEDLAQERDEDLALAPVRGGAPEQVKYLLEVANRNPESFWSKWLDELLRWNSAIEYDTVDFLVKEAGPEWDSECWRGIVWLKQRPQRPGHVERRQRLAKCKRPACASWFWKIHGRREYCSTVCQDKRPRSRAADNAHHRQKPETKMRVTLKKSTTAKTKR